MTEFHKARNIKSAEHQDLKVNLGFVAGANWAYEWFEENAESWIKELVGSRDEQFAILVQQKEALKAKLAKAKSVLEGVELLIEKSNIECNCDKCWGDDTTLCFKVRVKLEVEQAIAQIGVES